MNLWTLAQVHFDNTITLGNLVSAVTFLVLGAAAWADLRWRVSNLEIWRQEHQIDADARDNLLLGQKEILDRLSWVEEARQKAITAPFGKRRIHD